MLDSYFGLTGVDQVREVTPRKERLAGGFSVANSAVLQVRQVSDQQVVALSNWLRIERADPDGGVRTLDRDLNSAFASGQGLTGGGVASGCAGGVQDQTPARSINRDFASLAAKELLGGIEAGIRAEPMFVPQRPNQLVIAHRISSQLDNFFWVVS
jgi:hypothetical protein